MDKKEIGGILRSLREKSGKTQKEVGELLGRNQKVIGHWETGYAQPDANTLFLLCHIYDADMNEAFGFKATDKKGKSVHSIEFQPGINDRELRHIKKYRDLDSHGKELVDMITDKEHERCTALPEEDEEEQPTIFLPAFWNKASAGEGYYLDMDECDQLQVLLNEHTRKADMIITIQGDSMEPRYHDGDKVLVHEQPEVELGQVGIFRVGTMGYIKKRGPDRLISINPNYEDVYIGEEEECVCIGKVMGVLEDEWIVG